MSDPLSANHIPADGRVWVVNAVTMRLQAILPHEQQPRRRTAGTAGAVLLEIATVWWRQV